MPVYCSVFTTLRHLFHSTTTDLVLNCQKCKEDMALDMFMLGCDLLVLGVQSFGLQYQVFMITTCHPSEFCQEAFCRKDCVLVKSVSHSLHHLNKFGYRNWCRWWFESTQGLPDNIWQNLEGSMSLKLLRCATSGFKFKWSYHNVASISYILFGRTPLLRMSNLRVK